MDAENRDRTVHPSEPAEGSRDESNVYVTEDDLRRLLNVDVDTARLVLEQGRVVVDHGLDDGHLGLVIITKAALRERVGDSEDPAQLVDQAAALNSDLRLLGA